MVLTDSYCKQKPLEHVEGSEISINPLRYARLALQMHKAVKDLADIGFKVPYLPKLEIHSIKNNYTTAQLYNDRLIMWNYDMAVKEQDVIPHELFHFAEKKYQESSGDLDSEMRFVSSQSIAHGLLRQNYYVGRASVLWNGTNEAGAYIFGYFSEYKTVLSGKDLARKVLAEISRHHNLTPSKAADEVMDLLFMSDQTSPSMNANTTERLRLSATVVMTAVMLEQENFDTAKTAIELLKSPDQNIKRICDLGRDGIAKSIASAERLISNNY